MSRVQSIAFDNSWESRDARLWMKKHNHIPIKRGHRTPNQLRYRIQDPKKFARIRAKKISDGITLYFGFGIK